MESKQQESFSVAGTNINEVKRRNEQSGMSYNEAKEWMAKNTGGHGTGVFSDTNIDEVRKEINQK